jgi:tRNA pseudouridine55 synthase
MVSGVVLVDKPKGLSSHGGVAAVRRALGTKKIGHAGTLDPAATGLLVLGVNAGTRLLNFFVGVDKEYSATLRLGYATTTDDAEGEPILVGDGDLDACTEQKIATVLEGFRGEIDQVPSTYSAIKVQGKRAYDLARSGSEVELASRRVTISRLECGEISHGVGFLDVELQVECSSGTYIRALARDVGKALLVGGHLVALRRTRVGPCTVEGASAPEEVKENQIISLADAARLLMPAITLEGASITDISHGRSIPATAWPTEGPLAAIDGDTGHLVAILQASEGRSRILMGVPPAER